MVDLPKKKVGIVACSGEELAEGTVTRLAALKVLEQLRPGDTVTICLPLFLAGGEGDRAFAKFYPTIAVDGCELRCAAKATEMYSNKPAASVVVSELVHRHGLGKPEGLRQLNPAGKQAADLTAEQIAGLVDDLLGKRWSRKEGSFQEPVLDEPTGEPVVATCSCGSGIPIQKVNIDGKEITLIALPAIFQQFQEAGKTPSEAVLGEMLETVKLYNPIPPGEEAAYSKVILHEYAEYWKRKTASLPEACQ